MVGDGQRPGYCRRLLIEPAAGAVSAALEDDYHRMWVRLTHRDGVVTAVESRMDRAPWSICPGAMRQLEATFLGVPLASVPTHGDRTANCTHLRDLVLFAAAHAGGIAPVAYEVFAGDPVEGTKEAILWRDGEQLLAWRLHRDRLVLPEAVAGQRLAEIGGWIATLPPSLREAARILRWATMVSFGRQVEVPAQSSAERFATGACFALQPERARRAVRSDSAIIDFSEAGREPLAERGAAFASATIAAPSSRGKERP